MLLWPHIYDKTTTSVASSYISLAQRLVAAVSLFSLQIKGNWLVYSGSWCNKMFDRKWSQGIWFALCITVVIAVVTPDRSGLEKTLRAPHRTEWDLSPLAETVCEEAVWSQLIHESELWRAHSIFSGHQNLHDTNDINPTASRRSSEHVAWFPMHILNDLISVTMISLACVQLNSSISKQLTMWSGHGFTSLCGKGGWARKLAKRNILFLCSKCNENSNLRIFEVSSANTFGGFFFLC